MSIEKELLDVIAVREAELKKRSRYIELKQFYERMKKKGVAKKPEYGIPLIDTIGHKLSS